MSQPFPWGFGLPTPEDDWEGEMDSDTVRRWAERKDPLLCAVLGGLVAAGLIFVIGGVSFEKPHFLHEVCLQLGIALFIAGVLGLTVDDYLRRGLLQDVFKQAFGYIIHPDLKPEINWVYGLPMLCTEFNLTIDLADHGGVLVAHATLDRRFKNISNELQSPLLSLSVEEYDFPNHPSAILDMRYDSMDGRKSDSFVPPASVDHKHRWVGRLEPAIKIAPRGEISVWAEFRFAARDSDSFPFFFRTATKNPRVTVNAPKNIEHNVIFATREDAVERRGEAVYQHRGTMLPMQGLAIDWWPKP